MRLGRMQFEKDGEELRLLLFCWRGWRRRSSRSGRGFRLRLGLLCGLGNDLLRVPGVFSTAALLRERGQILLTSLKCLNFGISRSLEVHAEPKDGNDQPGDAGGDVLGNLQALVGRELLNLCVVGLDLDGNCRTVHVAVLRLHHRNRRWSATRTSAHRCSHDAKRRDLEMTHKISPSLGCNKRNQSASAILLAWHRITTDRPRPERGCYSPRRRWSSCTRTCSAPRAPAGDSRSMLSTAPQSANPTPTRSAIRVPSTG